MVSLKRNTKHLLLVSTIAYLASSACAYGWQDGNPIPFDIFGPSNERCSESAEHCAEEAHHQLLEEMIFECQIKELLDFPCGLPFEDFAYATLRYRVNAAEYKNLIENPENWRIHFSIGQRVMSEAFLLREDHWEFEDCSEGNFICLSTTSPWSNGYTAAPEGYVYIDKILDLDPVYTNKKTYRWYVKFLFHGYRSHKVFATNNYASIEMRVEFFVQKKGKAADEKHYQWVKLSPHFDDQALGDLIRAAYVDYFKSIDVRIEPELNRE